jgi:hypothetical protein
MAHASLHTSTAWPRSLLIGINTINKISAVIAW